MTDTIIKGSGNSRMIKTVPNIKEQVHDLDGLLDLLIQGFPVDFGPLNPAGCEVIGDNLNKSTLLTDSTESALWGNAGDRTVDDALVRLGSLVAAAQNTAAGRARVSVGSYVGTGVGGPENPNSLTFPFAPALVVMPCKMLVVNGEISDNYGGNGTSLWVIATGALTTEFKKGIGFGINNNYSDIYAKKSSNGLTISWYSSYKEAVSVASYQYNDSRYRYYYVALG